MLERTRFGVVVVGDGIGQDEDADIVLGNSYNATLQITNVPYQANYRSVPETTHGVIVAVDLSNPNGFQNISQHLENIQRRAPKALIMIVGTNSNAAVMTSEQITASTHFLTNNSAVVGCFTTSAPSASSEEVLYCLATMMDDEKKLRDNERQRQPSTYFEKMGDLHVNFVKEMQARQYLAALKDDIIKTEFKLSNEDKKSKLPKKFTSLASQLVGKKIDLGGGKTKTVPNHVGEVWDEIARAERKGTSQDAASKITGILNETSGPSENRDPATTGRFYQNARNRFLPQPLAPIQPAPGGVVPGKNAPHSIVRKPREQRPPAPAPAQPHIATVHVPSPAIPISPAPAAAAAAAQQRDYSPPRGKQQGTPTQNAPIPHWHVDPILMRPQVPAAESPRRGDLPADRPLSNSGVGGGGSVLFKTPPEKEEKKRIEERVEEKKDKVKEVEPPEYLCCALSLELMKDPIVVFPSGQTYEKEVLDTWVAKCKSKGKKITCPNTRKPIDYMTKNIAIAQAIEAWREEHPEYGQKNAVEVPPSPRKKS